MKIPPMDTKHLRINFKIDKTGSSSLNIGELSNIFNELIGRTAKSITDAEIEKAFEDGFAEWRRGN